MNHEDALRVVREVMDERLGIEAHEVVPEANLREDLGLDSLDAVDLVEELGRTLGRRIDQSTLERLTTVADVAAAVGGYELETAGAEEPR